MHLYKLPFLFLLLTGYALCNEKTKGLCPDPDGDTLVKYFYDSNITHITKEMFESCNQLKSIILLFGDSKIYNIDADAFENLNSLKRFTIDSYKIPHVKKGFFKLTSSVSQIRLRSVDIEEIDSDAFEDFKNLEEITINFNEKWKHLPENLFKNLSKLRIIDLHDNSLESLTWEEFKGLTNVKRLNLDSNKISSFDAEKISTFMPNLKFIGIVGNPVECKNRRAFAEELKEKLNPSVYVGYPHQLYYFTCQEDD